MKKKVLVTGSNGVLGKNLVYYLDAHYKDEFELYLLDIQHVEELKKRFKTYEIDIRNKAALEQIIKKNQIDVVVHSAAASPAYDDATVYDVIINGTENLLDCALNKSQVDRVVYISSTSVYGVSEKMPVLETDELQPYDAYNKGKIEAEKICERYRREGKCVPVLRPRSFLGPERLGTFAILYEWASEGRNFPMVGHGKHRYQLLDVDDLCQAVYLAMTKPKENANDTFNIGAEDFLSLHEDYQAVLDEAGYHKKIICFPTKFMFTALWILEKLKLSPFYKRLYLKLNKDYYVSIDKAKKKLGYKPQYSNKDSLIRNYHWYLDYKKDHELVYGAGNNMMWKQGIFKFVKLFF